MGYNFPLSKNHFALKNLVTDKDTRIEIEDLISWLLSGRPEIANLLQAAIKLKRRVDGFLYSGIETFRSVIDKFIADGKAVEYHVSNLKLALNRVSKQGFILKAKFMAFSPEVLALKKSIGESHPNIDSQTQKNKKVVIRLAFEPKGITPEQLVAKLNHLNKNISYKAVDQTVSIALESECPYVFDVFEAKGFTDLMVKAKVNQSISLEFETTATASQLFSSD